MSVPDRLLVSSRLVFFVGFTGWWFHAPPATEFTRGWVGEIRPPRQSVIQLEKPATPSFQKIQVWSKIHRIVVLQTHAATLLNASSSFNNNWLVTVLLWRLLQLLRWSNAIWTALFPLKRAISHNMKRPSIVRLKDRSNNSIRQNYLQIRKPL